MLLLLLLRKPVAGSRLLVPPSLILFDTTHCDWAVACIVQDVEDTKVACPPPTLLARLQGQAKQTQRGAQRTSCEPIRKVGLAWNVAFKPLSMVLSAAR